MTAAGHWVRLDSLGSADPEYRDQLLARAVFELILIRVTVVAFGPGPAAIMYAARGGQVRVSPDGTDLMIRAGGP